MIKKITETREVLRLSDNFGMRIGIHMVYFYSNILFILIFIQGHIIGGIIGTDIVRYDIYGKDNSIANLMESSGTKGRINVSHPVKYVLEKDQHCKYKFENEKIEEYNNEKVKCYLLRDKDAYHWYWEYLYWEYLYW